MASVRTVACRPPALVSIGSALREAGKAEGGLEKDEGDAGEFGYPWMIKIARPSLDFRCGSLVGREHIHTRFEFGKLFSWAAFSAPKFWFLASAIALNSRTAMVNLAMTRSGLTACE